MFSAIPDVLRVLIPATVLLTAWPAQAAEPQSVRLRFVVAIGELGMAASNEFAAGKRPGDKAELTLHADIVKPAEAIRPGRTAPGAQSFATEALARSLKTHLSGDAERIVGNFAPAERDDLRAAIAASPDMLTENTRAIAAITRVTVHGWAYFGDFLLVLAILEYPDRSVRRVYPFVETPEGWLQTNALASDATFDLVFSAWRAGEVLVLR